MTRAVAPDFAADVSGLLVVTNFPGTSFALLEDAFDAAGAGAALGFGFVAGAADLATLPVFAGDFAATGAFLATTGFVAAAFFGAAFPATAFDAALRAGAFAAFAAAPVFAAGLAAAFFVDFAAVAPVTRALSFATAFLAGAFAAFARATGFALLFAIPRPIM